MVSIIQIKLSNADHCKILIYRERRKVTDNEICMEYTRNN